MHNHTLFIQTQAGWMKKKKLSKQPTSIGIYLSI